MSNYGYYGPHMWGGDGMGWGWSMGLHGIFGLFLLGLLVVGVVYAVRALSPKGSRRDSAIDILAARYANGEIDREEFQQRKRDLESM